jgi:amino acid adenylation domain-containing protein
MMIKNRLHQLRAEGISVWLDEGKLKFDAPASKMDGDWLEWLKAHKCDVIHSLSESVVTLLPASRAQQRFWLSQQLSGDGSQFNLPLLLRLTGELQLAALQQAVDTVVSRHQVLQCQLFEQQGQIYQRWCPERRCEIRQLQLSEAELAGWIDHELMQSLDLTTDMLIRVCLLQLAEQDYVLLINVHHAVADGWSMGNLCRELVSCYQAAISGQQLDLPELLLQYADICEDYQDQTVALDYWRQQLAGCPVMLDLPCDYPRSGQKNLLCAKAAVSFSPELVHKLQQFCREQQVTPFNVLLAAYYWLLSRFTGENDLLVGVPVAGRLQPETEPLIGCFINNLVLRNQVNTTENFLNWVSQVQHNSFAAQAHQSLSFDVLLEKLNPPRIPGRSPLFQTMFVLQHELMPAARLASLQIEPLEWQRRFAPYELSLCLELHQGRLNGYFEYASTLFAENTMAGLAEHYLALLEQALDAPDQPLNQLSCFSVRQYQQWLEVWNRTDAVRIVEGTVTGLLEQQLPQHHHLIAVTASGGQLTYAQLMDWSARVAVALRQVHQPGEVIAVSLPRGLELAVSMLGIMRAGLVYLPLDPQLPRQRTDKMLAKASVRTLICPPERTAEFSRPGLQLLNPGWISQCRNDNANICLPPLSSQDPCYLIFTSGSTGEPKGTLISHQNLLNYCYGQNSILGLHSADVMLQQAAIGFDVFFEEVIAAWLAGAELVFRPEGQALIRARELLAFVRQHRISCINLTTAHWHTLVQEISELNLALPDSLRWVLIGGEAVQPDKLAYWNHLNVPLLHLYGQTEVCCDSTAYVFVPGQASNKLTLPIGRPIANTQVYLLDADMQPVPVGAYGEIYIGGAGVALGYLDEPELTATKFVPNPFHPELSNRLCRTGDRGRINCEGELEFAGRFDHQVKIRGYRIELSEIESCIIGHPAVQDLVVTTSDGSAGQQLIAYCVKNTDLDEDQLTEQLRCKLSAELPAYAIPACFIYLPQIPLNLNGKVDRKQLPAPDPSRLRQHKLIQRPATELEACICQIWSDCLQLSEISTTDNFFELGGHSLILTQLASRIEQQTGTVLVLSDLFEAQTVQAQAALVLRVSVTDMDEAELLALLDEI